MTNDSVDAPASSAAKLFMALGMLLVRTLTVWLLWPIAVEILGFRSMVTTISFWQGMGLLLVVRQFTAKGDT